jgi:biopolymer transport protein ExbD
MPSPRPLLVALLCVACGDPHTAELTTRLTDLDRRLAAIEARLAALDKLQTELARALPRTTPPETETARLVLHAGETLLDGVRVDPPRLAESLRARAGAIAGRELRLAIRADPDVEYARLLAVLDAANSVGVQARVVHDTSEATRPRAP